jgi:TspO/MBR family
MFSKLGLLVAFVTMIAVNTLANLLPINGKTTGQISDQYPNLFVPAGFTFAIWGIIYMLLTLYVIQKLVRPFSKEGQPQNMLLMANFGLNGLWIMVWHFEMPLMSLGVMLLLLFTLVRLNTLFFPHSWFHKLVFGVYLGWICVATIANTTAILVHFGWQGYGFSDAFWAATMVIIGGLLASITAYLLNNVAITLPVLWAFVGIYSKRAATVPVHQPLLWVVEMSACLVGLLGIGFVVSKVIHKKIKA